MKEHLRALLPGLLFIILFLPLITTGQNFLQNSQISGSFQADAAYYLTDSKMGITDSTLDGKAFRIQGYTEVNYSYKNFSAGMRFEAYLPPLLGYDAAYQGLGVPYWWVKYKNKLLEVTAGNFYEQFGDGMIFRTYQDWTLGYDNSLRGLRVKLTPFKGIAITGVAGVQRYYWVPFKDNNRGIVKGADLDFYLNDMVPGLSSSKFKLSFGGSFVSNYQKGKSLELILPPKIYELKLPENVATYGGRVNLNYSGFNFYTEYAHKINDPSAMNDFIYKNGNAWLITTSYSRKNFGITAKTKWIDNMSFKSDRMVTLNGVDINYLPAITKEHTYFLAAMYPYATQPNGEVGAAVGLTFTLPKRSKLGGKYGMSFEINFSQVNAIKKTKINDTIFIDEPGTLGYKTKPFAIDWDDVYYQEFSIEVTKKFNKRWKGIFNYLYQTYNKDVIEGYFDQYGTIYSNIAIVDLTYKITRKYALRGEIQGLWTKQDKGNWLAGLLEFTISPKWFFSISDQWNFGNPKKNLRIHYYNISAGFIHQTTRIALSYGRQREGIICVGGVCRYVPESSGITLSITSSF
ncbi:MAG: hypothetical protein H8E51_10940 [Bacteroidetes bacterium]|nr:hypothetical protein [Bacteroidota bacterium]